MSNFLMGANKPIEDIEATLRAATKSALNDARLVGRRDDELKAAEAS
jgi:hypothetical protein